MAEIKSALEIALEKADRLGRASQQEMQEAELRDRARHLAAKFLQEKVELVEEISKFPIESQPLVRDIIKEVLLRNVILPRETVLEEPIKRAQAGLLQVARNKKAMQRTLTEVEQLFKNFKQIRDNSYQQLKANFEARLGSIAQALETQMQMKLRVDIEHSPQFQEEWRKFEAQLLGQFEPLLERCKAQMATL